MARKIKIFQGAAIMYDEKLEKEGFSFSTNTPEVETVKATSKNIKKYIKDKKYPDFKRNDR